MGTRNLVAVKLDGEYRIAQYGQWDGYPTGQGRDVLAFLAKWDRPTFERKLRAASFYTPEELTQLWRGAGADESGSIEYGKAKAFGERMPEINRDTGAEILQIVQDRPDGIKLQNNIAFASDSLFCEWGYVLDLDENALEVFKGFNYEPLPEGDRFASFPVTEKGHDGTPYYPIRRVARYPLDKLPTVEQMDAECNPEEEEEAA